MLFASDASLWPRELSEVFQVTSLNTRLCSGATCRWSCYKTFTRPPWRRWRRPRTSACGSRPTPSWASCTLTAATTHACRGFSNSFISPVRWVGLVPRQYSTLGELRADDSVSKRRKSVVVHPCVCGESVCVVCMHSVCGRGALFCAGTIC